MLRAQHRIERLNQRTGEFTLISIDEALSELQGFHAEPLELLLEGLTLPTPSASYRLFVRWTPAN
jgi:hypothetical protein